MSFLDNFWDNLLHIDKILDQLIESYPFWSYFILGFVIFAETAFIITSFLPSDVVLFAACSLMMVQKSFNPFLLIPIFYVSAILGDNLNFSIGRFLRSLIPFITGVSKKEYNWFFKRNLIGITLWTILYCALGVFFGNFDFVKNHFGIVAIGIGCITIITAIISLFIRKLILERKQK